MEIKNSWLMLIATVATFIILILLMYQPIPDANAQIFLAVSSFVLGFFFGSSTNKARPPLERKGDLQNENTDPTPPTNP